MRVILLLCAAFALSAAAGPEEQPVSAQQNKTRAEKLEQLLKTGRMSYWDGGITASPYFYDEQTDCPPSWLRYGSRCFGFISSPMAWIDAEKHCWYYEANLVSIHDQQENDFIHNYVLTDGGYYTSAWIGASDGVRGRDFLWSDGSVFDATNLNKFEPSFLNRWAKCVAMDQRGYLKKWYCEALLPFICATRPAEDILPGNQPPYYY